MDEPLRAHIRSASGGRSSKVIKDRQRVEVSVEVPEKGGLTLSEASDGRYSLHASEGGEGSAGTTLATGEMRTAEHEPDRGAYSWLDRRKFRVFWCVVSTVQ
jgi:hypothetical protein